MPRAQGSEGHVGLGREHAERQLLLAHLEREDADRLVLPDRHVLGDVERQTRLAHSGAAGDDDQVRRIEPAAHLVEVGEARRQADEAGGGPLLEIRQGVRKDVAQGDETLLDGVLPQTQDRLLGPAQGLLRHQTAVEAIAGDGAARLDQAPADRALLDDLDVVLEPTEIRQLQVETRQIGHAADRVESVLLLESRLDRPQVDFGVGLLHLEHRAVDGAIALGVEVLGA